MTVEQAQYVNQLNTKLPEGNDSVSEGDDHIRLIKEAITKSFPNIDAPVTATPEELNRGGVFASVTYNGAEIVTSFGVEKVEWIDQEHHESPWFFAKITFSKELPGITGEPSSEANGDINAMANVQVTAFANKAIDNTDFVTPTVVDLEPGFVVVAFYQHGRPEGVENVVWPTGFCLTIIENKQ
jgi:hypothetical protein